jgi:hypothetical protein
MNKKILGIRLKAIIIFLIIMLILIPVSVACNRSAMKNFTPSQSLIGKWTGECEISAPFKKGQSPSPYEEDWINIEIIIKEDGSVTGLIGDAQLTGCTVQQNRTRFEKLINIKTDYIITGSLKNGITKQDTAIERNITIPFNISDAELKGSIFEVESWKYPDPLFPRLLLVLTE